MITLRIGSFLYTEGLRDASLLIRQYSVNRSTFTASVTLRPQTGQVPRVGEEIVLTQDQTVVWGGILTECEIECFSPTLATATLRGQGYEHLLHRGFHPLVNYGDTTTMEFLDQFLSSFAVTNERMSIAEIRGIADYAENVRIFPERISTTLDTFTARNGAVWWVDSEKGIHVAPSVENGYAPYRIEIPCVAPNCLTDLQKLTFRGSVAGYVNTRYVYNEEEGVAGKGRNLTEIFKLSGRYGYGQYGTASQSKTASSQAECDEEASALLTKDAGTEEIEFSTDAPGFEIGQRMFVLAPICGIDETETFCITEVRTLLLAGKFTYTVIAKQAPNGIVTVPGWEAAFAGRSK